MNNEKGGRFLLVTLFAALCVTVAVIVKRRFSRFEVSGVSMSPTFNHGDWLLVDTHAFRRHLPRPGDVVILHDPRDSSRQLIKRVRSTDSDGAVEVRGDNAAESTDSRAFGRVGPSLLVGKVRWRLRLGKPASPA